MAALEGIDTWEGEAVVSTPITLGATILTMTIPRGVCIAGIDIDVSDLDSNASPLLALDVGDAVDQDRFIAANTIAQDGGLLEYQPVNTARSTRPGIATARPRTFSRRWRPRPRRA